MPPKQKPMTNDEKTNITPLPQKEEISTVSVVTLGCKVNQCDEASMIVELKRAGFRPLPFPSHADTYIINTCTVTAFADFQSRQLVRRALRINPQARVIVTGCLAQTQPGMPAAIEGVTVVAGNDHKHQIADLLSRPADDFPLVLAGDIFRQKNFPPLPVAGLTGRTRAFFKIQDGCDAFCTYCIVPYARGRSRSLPVAGVHDGVHRFAGEAFREIVLTGIHLGSYGQDLEPPTDLAGLVEGLLPQYRDVRFRLSSIEPLEITDDLLALFGRHENLCPHLHIPLQSGDDTILEKMKRGYDRAFFRSLTGRVVQSVPDIAIGADVMVGFPGEGEKEFTKTLSLLEELPLAYLHVFPYSERPGTAAMEMPGHVPDKIKKDRAKILRTLGAKKREAFSRKFLGRTVPVLVEGSPDKNTGLSKGFSHNYLPVLIGGGKACRANTLVHVKIGDYRRGRLTGEVVYG